MFKYEEKKIILTASVGKNLNRNEKKENPWAKIVISTGKLP